MNRHIKIVLALSVVLNMLLAGVLLGDISGRLVTPKTAVAAEPFDIGAQLAKLPQDKRDLFESLMGPAKKKMDDERSKIDAAKKVALELLKADSFDASAYLTQVDHINDMHMQMKRHIAKAVVELAKQLTQQERVIVAVIISHPPFTMPSLAPKQDNSSQVPER